VKGGSFRKIYARRIHTRGFFSISEGQLATRHCNDLVATGFMVVVIRSYGEVVGTMLW